MARNNRETPAQTAAYRHQQETRMNNPSVGLAPDGETPETTPAPYAYNPHLQPLLRSDRTPQLTPPYHIC